MKCGKCNIEMDCIGTAGGGLVWHFACSSCGGLVSSSDSRHRPKVEPRPLPCAFDSFTKMDRADRVSVLRYRPGEGAVIRPHTTHHADFGCQSARYEATIRELVEALDWLLMEFELRHRRNIIPAAENAVKFASAAIENAKEVLK